MGIQKYQLNEPSTVPGNAVCPQPARQANTRGPKSRAGLLTYPALAPKDIPMAATTNSMIRGPRFAFTAVLRRSRTTRRSGVMSVFGSSLSSATVGRTAFALWRSLD